MLISNIVYFNSVKFNANIAFPQKIVLIKLLSIFLYNYKIGEQGESYQDITMTPSEFDTVKNLDTFVSYSCAEGCQSNYNLEWGMSYFGVALTNSIAQYACEEPLSVIMNRVFINSF